jgi:hypothetical protein
MKKTISISDINKEISAEMKEEKEKNIKWYPALIKSEDDGEFYWGNTDTKVDKFLTLDDCHHKIKEDLEFAGEEEILGYMKHLGYDAVLHDGEILILTRGELSK